MEPEGSSLPCSQGPATCPYPEPNESNPHPQTLFTLTELSLCRLSSAHCATLHQTTGASREVWHKASPNTWGTSRQIVTFACRNTTKTSVRWLGLHPGTCRIQPCNYETSHAPPPLCIINVIKRRHWTLVDASNAATWPFIKELITFTGGQSVQTTTRKPQTTMWLVA
jgi:hypothetical protein